MEDKEKINKYLDIAETLIVAIEVSGKVIFINNKGAEILGITKKEIIGKNWFDNFIPLRFRSEVKQTFKRLIAGEVGLFGYYENPVLTKSGKEIMVAWNNTTFKDEEKNALISLSSGLNITERIDLVSKLELFQFTVERAAEAIFWINPDGKVVYVNEHACVSLGYSAVEFLEMYVYDLDPNYTKSIWLRHWEELKKRSSFTIETEQRRKDGSILPVEISVNYVKFEDKEYNCAFARDITQRKNNEIALSKIREELEIRVQKRTSELAKTNINLQEEVARHLSAQIEISALKKRIEFILGVTKTGLDIIDSEFNIIYIDPEWQKAYGDPKGKKCYQYFMDRFRQCDDCGVRKALATKKPVVTEEILVKEGNRPIQITTIPYQDKDGHWFVAEINVDISQRKKMEVVLKENQEQRAKAEALNVIIEQAPDAIVVTDLNGKITKFNKTLRDKFLLIDEFLNNHLAELFLEKDKEKIKKKIVECIDKKRVENFEVTLEDKFGTEIPVLMSCSAIDNIQGKPEALIYVITDISDRKKVEESKDEFINTVSHELRTPLAAIKEGITIVLNGMAGKLNRKQESCLKVSNRNIDRLDRLVDNILDYQKLDYGKIKLQMKKNDINYLVKELKSNIDILVKEKKLKFSIELEKNLPMIQCDRDRIMQVLMNLVNNAIKFTNKGSVKVITKKSGKEIHICVQDTGIGIKKENLSKLFSAFSQIFTGKLKKSGTGLGLVISKKIIEKHGGRIWVESEYGRGSKFCFSLPIL